MYFMNDYFADYESASFSASNGIVDYLTISSGIYDALYIDKDISQNVSPNYVYPSSWDSNTVFQGDFDGNLNAGDANVSASKVRKLLIKRREDGVLDYSTVYSLNVPEDEVNYGNLSVAFNDYTASSGITYEYTLVPVNNISETSEELLVEGEPQMGAKVYSEFDGIMICDKDNVFYTIFNPNISYSKNKQYSSITPIDSKYPHIISSANEDYYSGTASGLFMSTSKSGLMSLSDIIKYQSKVCDFLNNGKPKLLKDWKGNKWIVRITEAPSIMADEHDMKSIIQFGWTEIADAAKEEDLIKNGIIVV